ncbi:MAG: hypothetical protein HN576_12695 [Bacteriovoracaceae bacterium]|jgi:hypothetical protein|nr:hypothetical protein [Bacteriovoracaceae bacterium]
MIFYKKQRFKYLKYLLIGTALLFSSCGKELFTTSKQLQNTQSNPIIKNSSSACSNFTHIKPEVDFLFLWDNSTSSVFINSQTRQALDNTIDLISTRFDYHILLAPLLGSGNSDAWFVSETPNGLGSEALSIKIDRTLAAAKLSTFPSVSGSAENGVERVREMLSNNISNGIFRNGAYTIVVVMSNEDDNSWVVGSQPTGYDRNNYINQKLEQILCLRGHHTSACGGSQINSQQMRFISIVAHSEACNGTNSAFKSNYVYKKMSEELYSAYYTGNIPSPSDQNGDSSPDSYNICDVSDFTTLFDGINNSIQDQVILHKYNYWPVATSGAAQIDPAEITIKKSTGTTYPLLQEPVPGGVNGFTFTNSVQTKNTRFAPSAGEPFTGYLVKLYGDAQVTYPECMSVTTQTPKEYFGYVNIQSKPNESTISLNINGQTIPQSTSNGWELVKESGQPKYYQSFNIKINGPGNYNPAFPAINKSGYFLKLNGNSIYSNGADLEVIYLPSGT